MTKLLYIFNRHSRWQNYFFNRHSTRDGHKKSISITNIQGGKTTSTDIGGKTQSRYARNTTKLYSFSPPFLGLDSARMPLLGDNAPAGKSWMNWATTKQSNELSSTTTVLQDGHNIRLFRIRSLLIWLFSLRQKGHGFIIQRGKIVLRVLLDCVWIQRSESVEMWPWNAVYIYRHTCIYI